jgi:hypothetical protein
MNQLTGNDSLDGGEGRRGENESTRSLPSFKSIPRTISPLHRLGNNPSRRTKKIITDLQTLALIHFLH